MKLFIERRRRKRLQDKNKNVIVDKKTGLVICGDESKIRTSAEIKAELERMSNVIDIIVANEMEAYRKKQTEKPPPKEMEKVK